MYLLKSNIIQLCCYKKMWYNARGTNAIATNGKRYNNRNISKP